MQEFPRYLNCHPPNLKFATIINRDSDKNILGSIFFSVFGCNRGTINVVIQNRIFGIKQNWVHFPLSTIK